MGLGAGEDSVESRGYEKIILVQYRSLVQPEFYFRFTVELVSGYWNSVVPKAN